jgi:hypothetical protein
LLSHAGKISYKKALEKSSIEYEKYKEEKRKNEHEESLKELEVDIKKILPQWKE